MVGLATCWLHPQAIYGLPPFNEASLGIVKQGCLGLRGRANSRVRGGRLRGGRLRGGRLRGGRLRGGRLRGGRLRGGRLRGGRLEKLGLAKDRQDLCDRLAAWNALRERDRWKGLD